jgi:Ca2+-binding RTX toxin-like protein
LEELGHHIDTQLNSADSLGDEGELFAALVQGRSIDANQLKRLQTEDDTATLFVNGQAVQVEQSTGVTINDNDDGNRRDGGSGDDTIHGNGGNDQLFGWGGNDYLTGGTGNDELRGGEGNDDLRGQAGDDYLVGGDGVDVFFGGTGNDIYVVDRASEVITEQFDQGIDDSSRRPFLQPR